MSSINFASLDHALSSGEDWANKAGYVPFVSLVTGYCRYEIGRVQTVASLAYAAFKLIEGLILGGDKSFKEAEQAAHYALHGIGNMARGFVEQITIVGNILCAAYDLTGMRMNYPSEPIRVQNPLFNHGQPLRA
jgi:hypothetical protein